MERVTRVRYRFADHDWAWHLGRLQDLSYRAAIVGQRGSGKTTLLFELREQLSALGVENHHIFLPQATASHASMVEEALMASRAGQVILVDGIERLSFMQRRTLFVKTKAGPGLVASVHTVCRLPTWIKTRTHWALMSEILRDLDLDLPDVQAAGKTAFQKSTGNIRDALADLYDQFASGHFNEIFLR